MTGHVIYTIGGQLRSKDCRTPLMTVSVQYRLSCAP